MQKLDQDNQEPVIGHPAQNASEVQPSSLATAGRRRTQEQGQGDLDDDWEDAAPADEAETVRRVEPA